MSSDLARLPEEEKLSSWSVINDQFLVDDRTPHITSNSCGVIAWQQKMSYSPG
jgi:hypothetical protein